jgi:hypothetical protein
MQEDQEGDCDMKYTVIRRTVVEDLLVVEAPDPEDARQEMVEALFEKDSALYESVASEVVSTDYEVYEGDADEDGEVMDRDAVLTVNC